MPMTKEERDKMLADLDKFCDEHSVGFDDLLSELSHSFAEQAENQDEIEVIRMLFKSISESLANASFDYYASTK